MSHNLGPTLWRHRWGPDSKLYYPDPRIALARHIEWNRNGLGETQFTIPEPDNYNYAILADRGVECDVIKNQVFYKDTHRNGWITLYYVPDDQDQCFNAWLAQAPWRSYWRSNRPVAVRQPRPLLWNRQRATELTLEERLYTQNYYRDFFAKYFSDDTKTFVERILGRPRDLLEIYRVQEEPDNEYDF